MQRRKFLATVGSLTAGTAAAMGTSAFSSVEANRSMTVNTVNDEDAFLALKANPDSVFASGSDSGTIEFTADKLNLNSYTEFADAFRITNLGTRRARVFIDISSVPDDLSMTIFGVEDGAFDGVGPSLGVEGGPTDIGPGQGVFLDPGATVKVSPAFGAWSGDISSIQWQKVDLTVYAVTEDSEIVGVDLFNEPGNNANTDFENDVSPNLVTDWNNQDTPSY